MRLIIGGCLCLLSFVSFMLFPCLIKAQTHTPLCIHSGDVIQDYYISAGDAQTAFLIVLGSFVPTYTEECAADCNADLEVTAGDAQAIFLTALGLGNCAEALPTPTPTLPPAPTGFAYVAPGSFTRGTDIGEPCRGDNENLHTVTLTRGFFMMQMEVSRQLWADLAALQPALLADPSDTGASPSMDHPVQSVTWYDTLLFANLQSIASSFTRCYYKDEMLTIPLDETNYTTGEFFCDFDANGFRLPTEAEWEYACRAGTTGAFSCAEPAYNSGNCDSCEQSILFVLEQVAVFCANSSTGPETVGGGLPNPWDIFDMHGNVFEWCWDWIGDYPTDPVTDPAGPSTGSQRCGRGGCWFSQPRYLRSGYRGDAYPDLSNNGLGFRLVRTATD